MVHAILDAGILILQRDGIIGFSTNAVAQAAGASVGSLYQYFANRDMLIAGIVERGVIAAEDVIRDAARYGATLPLDQLMRQLLNALFDQLEPYSDLLYEVLSATPVLSATGVAAMLETRLNAALTDFLAENGDRYVVRGGVPTRYLMINSAIYVALKWLGDRPPGITREQLVMVFVAQFTALVEQIAPPVP